MAAAMSSKVKVTGSFAKPSEVAAHLGVSRARAAKLRQELLNLRRGMNGRFTTTGASVHSKKK